MNNIDSKRIKNLKKEMIKELPKFPNNKATKQELESKHLADLLIVYLSWKARLITPRPRDIIIEKDVLDDSRWTSISSSFEALKKKVENGDDICPYLSLKAHEKGYTPAASGTTADTDKWADKDFLLNVMGFYHLHLGDLEEGKKISGRTDDVIFVRIDKSTFKIIGVFDHSVFEKTDTVSQEMNAERERLWSIFDKYSMQNVPAGGIVVSSMITTSAHSMQIVFMAQEYNRIIREHDPQLDKREYINDLYDVTNIAVPKKSKLCWYIRGTDLGILDSATNLYAVYRYGIN